MDLKMYYFILNVDEYSDEPKHYDHLLYVLLVLHMHPKQL